MKLWERNKTQIRQIRGKSIYRGAELPRKGDRFFFSKAMTKETKGISIVKVSGLGVSQPQHLAGSGGQEGAGKGQSTATRQAQAINLQCACNPVVISTVESIFILSDHPTRAI